MCSFFGLIFKWSAFSSYSNIEKIETDTELKKTISIFQLFDYVSFERNVIVEVFVRFSNENNNNEKKTYKQAKK